MKWPWTSFAHNLGNILPGDLIVVAGRTGSGKTTFGMNLALKLAVQELGKITYLALECGTDIPTWFGLMQMGHSRFTQRQADTKTDEILAAKQWVGDNWPSDLAVYDLPFPAPRDLVNVVSQEASESGLIIIDHLAAMDAIQGGAQERQVIGRVMRQLKSVAEQQEIPIVVLHQMGRGERQRSEFYRPPKVDDLYGSSIIEHTASIILGIYRSLSDEGRNLLAEYNKGAPIQMWRHEVGMGVQVLKARHGARGYDLHLVPEMRENGWRTDRLLDENPDYREVNTSDLLSARQP